MIKKLDNKSNGFFFMKEIIFILLIFIGSFFDGHIRNGLTDIKSPYRVYITNIIGSNFIEN